MQYWGMTLRKDRSGTMMISRSCSHSATDPMSSLWHKERLDLVFWLPSSPSSLSLKTARLTSWHDLRTLSIAFKDRSSQSSSGEIQKLRKLFAKNSSKLSRNSGRRYIQLSSLCKIEITKYYSIEFNWKVKITKYSIEFPLQIENYKIFYTFPFAKWKFQNFQYCTLWKVKITNIRVCFLKSQKYRWSNHTCVWPDMPLNNFEIRAVNKI